MCRVRGRPIEPALRSPVWVREKETPPLPQQLDRSAPCGAGDTWGGIGFPKQRARKLENFLLDTEDCDRPPEDEEERDSGCLFQSLLWPDASEGHRAHVRESHTD